jgi:signal transduction histidine kinase/CheY-like chemotaxis protein
MKNLPDYEKNLVWVCAPGQLPESAIQPNLQELIPGAKWEEFKHWICLLDVQLQNISDFDFIIDGKLQRYAVQFRDVEIPRSTENGGCKIRVVQAMRKSEPMQNSDGHSPAAYLCGDNFQNSEFRNIECHEVVNHIAETLNCEFVSIILGEAAELEDLGNLELTRLKTSGSCFSQEISSFPSEHFDCARECIQTGKVSEKYEEFSNICAPLMISGIQMGVLTITREKPLLEKDKLHKRLNGVEFYARVVELVRFVEIEKSTLSECQITTTGLEKDNRNLKQKNKNKDNYIATLSHDLRTPLSGILALSETLLDKIQGSLNPAQTESIRNIEEASTHMLEMINDLLDIAKFSDGNVELQLDWVDLVEIVESAIRTSSKLFDAKRQELFVSYQTRNLGLRVDGRRVKQVIINLLSNASKFTAEYGKIELIIGQKDEKTVKSVFISVKDSGVGIGKEDISKLFVPFYQVVPKGYLGKAHGSGLGLAIVKELVEAHGGLVTVESHPGKGSTFTVSIPMNDAPKEVALKKEINEISKSDSVSENHSTIALSKILIVEDNEVNIIGVSEYLRANSFEIIVAHNGREGIDKVIAERPDLVLMDVQMPVMNGIDATRKIREEKGSYYQQLPILMYTALGMPGDEEKCLSSGADEYFMKPFGLKNLVLKINKYINKSAGN